MCATLHAYLAAHRLGEALPSRFEVEFTEDSAVQADVLALLAREQDRLTAERLYGPPALVIEIVSYSSKRTDRLQKRRLYLEEGVPEYWVVDLEARHVERWRPGDEASDVVRDELVWHPDARTPPLTIDLPQL